MPLKALKNIYRLQGPACHGRTGEKPGMQLCPRASQENGILKIISLGEQNVNNLEVKARHGQGLPTETVKVLRASPGALTRLPHAQWAGQQLPSLAPRLVPGFGCSLAISQLRRLIHLAVECNNIPGS